MLATRRRFLSCLAIGGAGGALVFSSAFRKKPSPSNPSLSQFQRSATALGTTVSIIALAETQQQATLAMDAAFAEIELVESLMSIYRPDSQLSRLNRHGEIRDPHPYFVEVLARAQETSLRSRGAFDITVQPLWELFAAAKSGRLPANDGIDSARKLVDWRRVNFTRQYVRLDGPQTRVTLNGIAQGFATDRATQALRSHGIKQALIDAGEIGAIGNNKEGHPWRIGIQHPRREDAYVRITELAGRCLATSGDYATTFTNDFRNHHIFDPRTGRSPGELASVSVVADTGIEADALSTAAFVLGDEQGAEFICKVPGAAAFFVRKDGSTITTPGFPREG